jgi:hypothetical protein
MSFNNTVKCKVQSGSEQKRVRVGASLEDRTKAGIEAVSYLIVYMFSGGQAALY